MELFTGELEVDALSLSRPVGGNSKRDTEAHSHDAKFPVVVTDAGNILVTDPKNERMPQCVLPLCERSPLRKMQKGQKSTRAWCKTKSQKRGYCIAQSINYGDLIAADHKILTLGKCSRCGHRNALFVQIECANWIQSCPIKSEKKSETMSCLQRCLPEFVKDRSTSHRSETKGAAPSVELKKGPRSHLFKVANRNNGGTVRWDASATCGICRTECRMPRQQSKRDLVKTLTNQ